MSGASCTGTTCIATEAIYDFNSGVTKPLLTLTQDAGVSLSFPLVNSSSVLPQSTTSANIYHNACISDTCIAAGYFYNGSVHPLLIISSDYGTNWSYSIYV